MPQIQETSSDTSFQTPAGPPEQRPAHLDDQSVPAIPRPRIQVNERQLIDVINDAWRAVDCANQPTPHIFQRDGLLVQVRTRVDGAAIETLTPHSLRGILIRIAEWMKMSDRGLRHAHPDSAIMQDMMVIPDPELPHLDGVATSPAFASSGQLIARTGYHAEERLWLQLPEGFSLPEIPNEPAQPQIDEARALILEDLLVDFPFVEDSDRVHAVAAMLLPLVRLMIDGCTPLHVVEAERPGSGKGLLCNVISLVTTGTPCASRTMPVSEEEIRKMFTAELLTGRMIALLDNAREHRLIDSPSLASVLTTQTWTDRMLGQTRMATLPNQALWLLTGNCVRLSGELGRRAVHIRLDPGMEQPWLRTQFRHPDLLGWVRENRARLLHALLLMVQNWVAAGRPPAEQRLGSYERWSEVIGGILQQAGIGGFLADLPSREEESPDQAAWLEFTSAWWTKFGATPQGVSRLNDFCQTRNLMLTVRGEGSAQSQLTRLGTALQGKQRRAIGRLQLELAQDFGHHGKTYHLRELPGPEAPQAPQAPQAPGTAPDSSISDAPLRLSSPDRTNPIRHDGYALPKDGRCIYRFLFERILR